MAYFYGNYQYGNTKLKCNSFNEYEDKLKENYVVLKEDVRMRRIQKLLSRYKAKNYEIILINQLLIVLNFLVCILGVLTNPI